VGVRVVFVQAVGLIGVDQAFQHLQAIMNSLASFGVTHAARFVEDTNFLDVGDDVDAGAQSQMS